VQARRAGALNLFSAGILRRPSQRYSPVSLPLSFVYWQGSLIKRQLAFSTYKGLMSATTLAGIYLPVSAVPMVPFSFGMVRAPLRLSPFFLRAFA
jgi:hypothetical protein